jgi:hypothetical protein
VSEPRITVNGTELTEAQALAVRLALGAFQVALMRPDSLGEDDIGRTTAADYMQSIVEINMLMLTKGEPT